MDLKVLGKKLEKNRKNLKYSLKKIEILTGIKQGTIKGIEAGRLEPKLYELQKLADRQYTGNQ